MALGRLDRWLLAVLASSLLVVALRVLSWDDVGSPLQVAMQAAMPLPAALGLVACLRRTGARKAMLWPAALFLLGVTAVVYAWTDYEQRPGEESCTAKGFVPAGLGEAFEGPASALVLVAGIALVAGAILALTTPHRSLGAWVLGAACTLAALWFASPVCMGT